MTVPYTFSYLSGQPATASNVIARALRRLNVLAAQEACYPTCWDHEWLNGWADLNGGVLLSLGVNGDFVGNFDAANPPGPGSSGYRRRLSRIQHTGRCAPEDRREPDGAFTWQPDPPRSHAVERRH